MKKLIILIALFVAGNAAMAQDMVSAQARADKKTEEMKTSLALSPEQVTQVASINSGIAQKLEAANTNANFTAEQKAEQIKMNLEAEKQMLKGVLTDEQFAQYEKSQEATVPAKSAKSNNANINTSRSTIKGSSEK